MQESFIQRLKSVGFLIQEIVREFIRALEKDGFEFKRQRGSHKVYFHPKRNRQVLIAYHHSGETILSGMLHDLIDDAGWTDDDLIRLKLMKKG